MNKIYFWPNVFCIDEDDIWFVYGKLCVLCRYSLKLDECSIVGKLPVWDSTHAWMYSKIISVNNRLFIIPCWADDIIVYDTNMNKFSIITLENCDGMKFCGGYLVDKKIICIPSQYKYVISIDVDTFEVKEEFYIQKNIKYNNIGFFNDSALLDTERVLLVSPQSDKLYIYNLLDKNLHEILPCSNAKGFEFVVSVGKYIFLCDNTEQKIYKYDIGTHRIVGEFWPSGRKSIALHEMGTDRLLMDDFDSSQVVLCDIDFLIKMQDEAEIIEDRTYYYSCDFMGMVARKNNICVYFNAGDASFNWIENDTIIKKINISITAENMTILKKIYMSIDSINENVFYSLEDFLHVVTGCVE